MTRWVFCLLVLCVFVRGLDTISIHRDGIRIRIHHHHSHDHSDRSGSLNKPAHLVHSSDTTNDITKISKTDIEKIKPSTPQEMIPDGNKNKDEAIFYKDTSQGDKIALMETHAHVSADAVGTAIKVAHTVKDDQDGKVVTSTLGACLQRKRSVTGWKRNDGALTSIHGGFSVGDKVIVDGLLITYNGVIKGYTCDRSGDWARIEYDAGFSCDCVGAVSGHTIAASLNAFLESLGDGEQQVYYTGRISGRVTGTIQRTSSIQFSMEGNFIRNTWQESHRGMSYAPSEPFIRINVASTHGDSGAGLYMIQGPDKAGKARPDVLIGILKGGFDEGTTDFTPIWSIPIPPHYYVC